MSKEINIPDEIITNKIYLIRGQKTMLDRDLAELYGVTKGNLNKAVGRNIKRFPDDFMLALDKKEFDNLRNRFDSSGWGGTRKPPKFSYSICARAIRSISRSRTNAASLIKVAVERKLI